MPSAPGCGPSTSKSRSPNPACALSSAVPPTGTTSIKIAIAPGGGANALDFGAAGLTTDGVTTPHGYSVQLTQPLFEGFQNLNAVRQAKSTVQAAREALRTVEQTVLLDASTAYVNVVRDTAIVRLRENDVSVLSEQLKATKDRFDVGEVTRTDVAQAEARRAEALSTLAAAQANLKTSRAAYEQIIGHPPGNLVTPTSIRHLLPSGINEAMTLGDGENPIILAAVYNEEASLFAVEQIMGELLARGHARRPNTRSASTGSQSLNGLETADGDGPGQRAVLPGRRRSGARAPGQGRPTTSSRKRWRTRASGCMPTSSRIGASCSPPVRPSSRPNRRSPPTKSP